MGDHEHPERRRQDGEGDLGGHLQPAIVEPVGHDAAPRTEQHDRKELQARVDAERHAAVGQLQDQEGRSDRLHPRARRRHQLSDDEQPEVANPQRLEGPVHGPPGYAGGETNDLGRAG